AWCAVLAEAGQIAEPETVSGRCENRGMTVAVRDPVATMSPGLDDLRTTLSGLDDKGVTQTLRDVEALTRATQSVMLDVVAEAEARGIAVREGFGTTADLVAAMLHLSAADARARVEHAAMVGTRRAITGETLAPKLPATSAAFAAGEIGSGQLRVIAEAMAALPAAVPQPARDRAEADLAGYARDFDPRRLRVIARRLIANLDPDGAPRRCAHRTMRPGPRRR
ncbi:MAG: DUF222 domain-containing protein, partial [Pseudonocardiaceae bacterium]